MLLKFKFYFVAILLFSSASVSAKNITSVLPGLWSMHTQGKTKVMGHTVPFSKTSTLCVKAKNQRQAILPTTKGNCKNSEKTMGSIMYYKATCKIENAVITYNVKIQTSQKQMHVDGKIIKKSYPETMTTYAMTGNWIKSNCR